MCGVAVVPERDDSVRAAEVIAALCLATDLGMAFPFEHGLHTTLIAMRLADRLGVDRRTASETVLRLPAFPRRLYEPRRISPQRSSAAP